MLAAAAVAAGWGLRQRRRMQGQGEGEWKMTQRIRYVDSGGAEEICRRLDLVMRDAAATTRDPAKANVQVVLSLNRNALRSVPAAVLEKWIRKSLIDAVVAAVLAEKERVRQRN